MKKELNKLCTSFFLLFDLFCFAQQVSTKFNQDGSYTVIGETTISTPIAETNNLAFLQMKRMNFFLPFLKFENDSDVYNKTGYLELSDVGVDGYADLRIYQYNQNAIDKKGALIYGVTGKANGKNNISFNYDIFKFISFDINLVKSTDVKKLILATDFITTDSDCNTKFIGSIIDDEFGSSPITNIAPFTDIAPFGETGDVSTAMIATGLGSSAGYKLITYGQNIANKVPSKCVDQIMNQPVIIELKVKNATVKNIRMPGPTENNSAILLTPKQIFPNRSDQILNLMNNPLEYPNYVVIAAHRGYWENAPENSTASYDATIAAGIDMVELDVRLTKDDVLVAFHDVCLDRITTGSGFIRDKTWAEIQQLNLKDRHGVPTEYKMLSVREALEHLKGRALINFDVKEYDIKATSPQHTLRGWPIETNRYKRTFNASIALAKELGMLDQLLIKGKFTSNDIDAAMQDAGISLADVNYTPVTFGWDTKNSMLQADAFMRRPEINIMELTYKVSYDPLLLRTSTHPSSIVGKAISKGKRVGNYTYWPETCAGVWAEDDAVIGTPICVPNTRDYKHLYQYEYPTQRTLPTDSLGEPIYEVPTGEPIYGDPYADNELTAEMQQEIKKDLFVNDGRGDWDWIISKGANLLITDRPLLLKQYLEVHGLRSEISPIITEVKLFDQVEVTKKNTNELHIVPLEGLGRKIKDYRMVEFFTPDTRNVKVSCENFPNVDMTDPDYANKTKNTNGFNKNMCEAMIEGINCARIYGNPNFSGPMDSNAANYSQISLADIRKYPLLTLPQWSFEFPGYDIYTNANYFDVFDVEDSAGNSILNDPTSRARTELSNAPYVLPCSDVFGYMQSNGAATALSSAFEPEPSTQNFDAFIWDKLGNIKLIRNSKNQSVPNNDNLEIKNYYDGDTGNGEAEMALSGFIIAKDGAITIPSAGTNPTLVKRRTLIGLNGYQMMIAYFSTQSTPREAAKIMIDYGYKDVFMFDAGGSASMISSVGLYPNNGISAGPGITSGNEPSDINAAGNRVYRPIPTFMAVRVKNEFKKLQK